MRRITLLFVVLLLVLAGCKQEPTSPPSEPQLAPDFTLHTLDGRIVTLAQLHGKVVFLNFWASWCPPCRAEMPSMERLNEVFANQDFVMLAVNVEEEGATVLPEFLRENPHTFTVLLDPEAKAQKLYQVYQFPETFIIDKQGRVVERILGARDWSSTENLKHFSALIAAP